MTSEYGNRQMPSTPSFRLRRCTLKEFKGRMQEWWQGLEFKEMEQVTGFRQTDFSPEDGYQEFVDACEKWWNGKSYDEKRIIWKKYHNEE